MIACVCNKNPLAPLIRRLGLTLYRISGDNSILFYHDLERYSVFYIVIHLLLWIELSKLELMPLRSIFHVPMVCQSVKWVQLSVKTVNCWEKFVNGSMQKP